MSRRPGNHSRRHGGGSGGGGSSHFFPIALILLGGIFIFAYLRSGSGGFGGNKERISKVEGDFSCTAEVQLAIPFLKKVYGDSMRKILHVGPDTCSVVSALLKEEETEVWGVEPYDVEEADSYCQGLVRKGIVRVGDIRFPLPYRPKSFSLVIVSDTLDYLSPRYLNKTLADFTRVSAEGLVIFTGFPNRQRVKVAEIIKYGRAAKLRRSTWWARYFVQTSLEENEDATKKFEQTATASSFKPSCQIFHLKSYS